MLEPTPPSTTTECEEEVTEIDMTLLSERKKELQKVENDVENLSETQKLLAKLLGGQSGPLDAAAERLMDAVENSENGKVALQQAEKHANSRRTRIFSIALAFGTSIVLATAATLTVMKVQKRL